MAEIQFHTGGSGNVDSFAWRPRIRSFVDSDYFRFIILREIDLRKTEISGMHCLMRGEQKIKFGNLFLFPISKLHFQHMIL